MRQITAHIIPFFPRATVITSRRWRRLVVKIILAVPVVAILGLEIIVGLNDVRYSLQVSKESYFIERKQVTSSEESYFDFIENYS
jgi:hypothetical protein